MGFRLRGKRAAPRLARFARHIEAAGLEVLRVEPLVFGAVQLYVAGKR